MHSWTGRSLIAFAAALLLAGCSQPPATPPSTAPSFRCTPEAGGAEFDCTQQQYDEMLAKDKLYAEAEAVYRKFFEEDVRILRAGGVDEPTPVLLETTTGDFLEESMALYRSFRTEGTRFVGGEVLLVGLSRRQDVSKGGSVVALTACVDAHTVAVQTRGQSVGEGPIVNDVVYFGRSEGALKIQGADGEEVETCERS